MTKKNTYSFKRHLPPGIYSLLGVSPSLTLSALTNMKSYSFLPRDAFHLAVMDSHNITAIVTTDAHFQKVSHLKIYTCNPNML